MDFELSKYQQDILNYVKYQNRNLLIDAKAGSGKTSTLILIANELIKSGKKCLFLSFNKSIVDELKLKIPAMSSNIKTVHSLGLSFIRSYLYKKHNTNYEIVDLDIGKKKVRELCKAYYEKYFMQQVTDYCKETMSETELKETHNNIISDFVTVCNFIRLYCGEFSDMNTIRYLTNRFCKTLPEYIDDVIPEFYELVPAVINKLLELFENPQQNAEGKYEYAIDFLDMIFLPVYYSMNVPYSLKDSLDTVLVDECIPGTHYVVTNKGNKTLQELYKLFQNNKLDNIQVKSFNESTQQFEFKPIINVVNKGVKDIYEIETYGLHKIQATNNHPIMTQNGWKRLDELEPNIDYVYLDKPENQKTALVPNDDQLQIIYGSALGDGSLEKSLANKNCEYRLKITHCDKQFNYFKFKCDMLHITNTRKMKSGYTNKLNINQGITKMFILDKPLSKLDIIKRLDLRGLAILYMDDGSKLSSSDYYGVHISCNSFNEDETNALIQKLLEYNVYSVNKPQNRNGKSYNEIHLNTENAKLFFELIAPYMNIDCYYKNPISSGSYIWNNKYKSFGGSVIKSISFVGTSNVYDMEIAENHNFLVRKSYNCKGSAILVHNCQDLSMLQQLFVRRLYTGYNRFIFVGDKQQSIYGFNGADTKAVDNIKRNFQPNELPLSICYRCPEKVVRLAQNIVPSIEWNKNRDDKGVLDTITYSKMKMKISVGDIIVGRRNRDLLKIYKDFALNSKTEIKFKNKDMVSAIQRDITQCIRNYMINYAKDTNIDKAVYTYMQTFAEANNIDKNSKLYKIELDNYVTKYAKEHKQDCKKKDIMKSNQTLEYLEKCMLEYKNEGAYEYEDDNILTEYFDIITEFIEEYKKSHSSILVSDFLTYMESFLNAATTKYNVPVISSIHSMKGGEADTVYIYDYPRFPYKWSGMNSEDEQQEQNLQYVAITRAKKNLYLMLCDTSSAKSPEQAEKIEEQNSKCINNVAELNHLVDDLNAGAYNQ